MYCKDIETCFCEINDYCAHQSSGRALLVNAENYNQYQDIKGKIEADGNKACVYVSDFCSDNELPNMDDIIENVTGNKDYVLLGYSQAAMLRNSYYIEQMIRKLLEIPVSGHAIILLDHCEQFLKKAFSLHPDIQKRVILLAGEKTELPKIHLSFSREECAEMNPLLGIKTLLGFFEKMTDDMVKQNPIISVVSKFSPDVFQDAIISVSASDDIYSALCKGFTEISAGTEQRFGNDEQWRFLAKELSSYGNMSSVAKNYFGSIDSLSSSIGVVFEEGDKDKKWLLWICMKLFNNPSIIYLYSVLQKSVSVNDFEELIFLSLAGMRHDDPSFRQSYIERKRLLDVLPENLELLDQYIMKIGVYQRDSVYYLTNLSEKEELAFMQCMNTYEYTKDELLSITSATFPSIYGYLKEFKFDVTNTKVPTGKEELREKLTEYFEEYKYQKLTNRIHDSFLEKIERVSVERPYNVLQSRSSIVSKMDKENAQLYFFDALGVEYLGFIQERCEQYGLVVETSIAHCELPSITEKNKEFLHFFPSGAFDIKELDELKHHSRVIDYETCKLPVHLFRELQIVDKELKKIQSRLAQGICEQAIIVSDHGASRLAVIYEQENERLELDEKGVHSGRCCQAKEDPHIPYVTYWDGFAILANYERFKGGRKANVEVHGGATLEEVLVPIIVLSKKPTDIDICFVDPVIVLKGKDPASIIVYSNVPLKEPKLIVNEVVYTGDFCEDNKHARFIMPELKRTKDLTADFYDGDKKLAAGMEFRVQKNTQEQELFKNSPF